MHRRTIYFTAPRQVELREEPLPALGADEVLVETICSAVSAGTEMMIYRGEFPKQIDAVDLISSGIHYPTKYGYSNIGRVNRNRGIRLMANGKINLYFHFNRTLHTSSQIPIPYSRFPNSLSPEAACFLPNMETAVNLVQDAAPILGERVLVLGQGVIGLLTAALLKEFPLETLVTADHYPLRREASLALGVTTSLDPTMADFCEKALSHCSDR